VARGARLAARPRSRPRAGGDAPAPVRSLRRRAADGHRALITEPRLLLADEPTGNLDSTTGRAILDLLAELNDLRKLTVVMVTHDTFGATYGHRTIELADGRIVSDVTAPLRPRLQLVSDADPT
jgi:ABC-type uncharacterized transport system ATPase component